MAIVKKRRASHDSPYADQLIIGALFQVLREKRRRVVPQLVRRGFAVIGSIIGKEGVRGAFIDLGSDIFAGPALLHLVGKRDRRVLILVSEHTEERTVQVPHQVEHRGRARRRRLGVWGGAMDKAAPAIDRGIDLAA